MAELDERGHEILDPTPLAMPLKFARPPSMAEMLQRYVRGYLSNQVADQGMETFEEADDFDVGDDFDPSSPFEEMFHGQFDETIQMGNESGQSQGTPNQSGDPGTQPVNAAPAPATPSGGGTTPNSGANPT